MAFPPRRAANTHQPVRCQGSRRRASEGCPSFTGGSPADRPKKAGSSTRRAGHPMDRRPSDAPPASSSAGQPAFGT